MFPQLTIRRARRRNISGAKPGPSASPPLVSTSASPRTSVPRTRHGFTEARSSTRNTTLGLRCTSWYFFLRAKLCPPISIVSSSALYRNPTGTICGWPSGPPVASRPRSWLLRYSISSSVNTLMSHHHPRDPRPGALQPLSPARSSTSISPRPPRRPRDFHRVADVASRARPVRSCPASGEQPLAHLLRDRQVGDQVTVDVPDLTPPVAKRYGAKPARTRARPRPAENLPLHQRQKSIVHSSPPLLFTALADMMDRIESPDIGRKYSFQPVPRYGFWLTLGGVRGAERHLHPRLPHHAS